MVDAPEKIWIEQDDCPYFYEESELTEVGSPVTEYIRADIHARALLSAKREQQAEIDRLNKVIERMQATMSSQAEQWTRSMAEAKREGMMDAATFLRDHATISNGEALDPAVPEILAFIRAKVQEVDQ